MDPLPGSGGGSARIRSACFITRSRLNGPLARPLRSMSASSLPNLSGSASAASTTASAFSSVRRAMPVAFAALSAARPFELVGNLPGCLSVRVPCRPFAATLSNGSSARLMATASDSVKSLRTVFSANSPATTASRSTMVTGIFDQPSF